MFGNSYQLNVSLCFFSMKFLYEENPARKALVAFLFVAKQQAPSLSIKLLDILLHAQQVMSSNSFICDV